MNSISPVFRPNDRASFRDSSFAWCLAFEFANHSLNVRKILLSTFIDAHIFFLARFLFFADHVVRLRLGLRSVSLEGGRARRDTKRRSANP